VHGTDERGAVGWLRRSAMVERYRARRGISPLDDLTYYDVLYNFRLSVLLEGIYQRSRQDPTVRDQHEIADRALANVDRALVLVNGAP
jgi:aminoglycoside phosphotransferase (APT) family kinase protein